jgi:dienelactone hydrolase
MPGLHPLVTQFGQRLVDAGFTVYMPSLFGRPGRPFTTGAVVRAIAEVCVAREFTLFADRAPPIISWLRALATRAHAECGGPGVGAVGMCFTGSYALAMAVDPSVLAPVMSQPGLPAPISARKRAAVSVDAADLARIKQRTRTRDGLCVMGLRFTSDNGVPAERFAKLRRELGDAFIAIEIDSSPGNAAGIDPKSHSVLTMHLVDRPGHPTREALDRVIAFLKDRLRPSAGHEAQLRLPFERVRRRLDAHSTLPKTRSESRDRRVSRTARRRAAHAALAADRRTPKSLSLRRPSGRVAHARCHARSRPLSHPPRSAPGGRLSRSRSQLNPVPDVVGERLTLQVRRSSCRSGK